MTSPRRSFYDGFVVRLPYMSVQVSDRIGPRCQIEQMSRDRSDRCQVHRKLSPVSLCM